MSGAPLRCGFIPLVDSAPVIIAREIGFAAEEGVDLVLQRTATWSTLRDKLAMGLLDAAHMLSPTPIATWMELGKFPARLDVLSVLSINGAAIGVSRELADRMRRHGSPRDFASAGAIGKSLIAATEGGLRVGVPFPFSMHAELLYYWLGALGLPAPQELDVRTVPPPRMADAIGAGDIDAFCVGEPWGSIAVEMGAAELILPGAAIWRFAPEKVLAVRHEWAEAEEELAARLIRALWRSAKWLGDPANRVSAAEIMARPGFLDVAPEIIDRAMTGRLTISPDGEQRSTDNFMVFSDGAATFPWRSQAVWIATRMAGRSGIDRRAAAAAARACFRADLHRRALGSIGADLPGASEKLEGALAGRTPVASTAGSLFLGPDSFFDDEIFDSSSY